MSDNIKLVTEFFVIFKLLKQELHLYPMYRINEILLLKIFICKILTLYKLKRSGEKNEFTIEVTLPTKITE